MVLMVPERARITSDCDMAPPARYLMPASSSPSVMPVAAKNASSEATRSPVVSTRGKTALDGAAQALDRAGGDDAFGRAPGAEQQVNPGAVAGGHDGAGHVAVGDELDPRARRPDLGDEPCVPRPVQDDHGHVVR